MRAGARSSLPFELREGPDGGTVVVARGETYSLPEISAFVLRQAKAVAEAALGEPVERAVITVPGQLQRAAARGDEDGRAARGARGAAHPERADRGRAGLRSGEQRPGAHRRLRPRGRHVRRHPPRPGGNVFEVLATAGDTALGGDDIDIVIADRMADDLLAKHRLDARAQPLASTAGCASSPRT